MPTANEQLRKKVSRLPSGKVFSVDSLNISSENRAAAQKALSRLCKEGKILRIKRGLYSKSYQSSFFGAVPPGLDRVLEFLITSKDSNLMIGGISLYNSLGLTTQNPATHTVLTNGHPKQKVLGNFKIKLRKIKSPIGEKTVKIIQFLEVIKEINSPFDAQKKQVVKFIGTQIDDLTSTELVNLGRLSIDYSPWVRVYLSAFLNSAKDRENEGWRIRLCNKISKSIIETVSSQTAKIKIQEVEKILNEIT